MSDASTYSATKKSWEMYNEFTIDHRTYVRRKKTDKRVVVSPVMFTR